MSVHLVIDLHNFAHLACELPWWSEKCAIQCIRLHVPRNCLRPKFIKLDDPLHCAETLGLGCCATMPDSFDNYMQIYETVEALAASQSTAAVLVFSTRHFAKRFGLLGRHEKVTVCCGEHDLLPLWWSARLDAFTLSEMGWRKPAAWPQPQGARPDDDLFSAALGGDEGRPAVKRQRVDLEVHPPATSSGASTASQSDEEPELASAQWSSAACRAGMMGFPAASALADGRFVVPT